MEIVLAALHGALVGALCVFAFERKRRLSLEASHAAQLKHLETKKGEPTFDCRELLHDLTAGPAMVKIIRIDPSEVYIRRT